MPDLLIDTVNEDDRLARFTTKFMKRIQECLVGRFDNIRLERLKDGKQNSATYLIGLRATREWTNPLTVGPVATDPAAKEFRALWKEKTQLRKFADARICECMVWAEAASESVPPSILQFILINHFRLPAGCMSWRSVFPSGFSSPKDVNTRINKAFADLSAILRSAKCLPLMITNIHGISSYLRDTEPYAAEVLCRADQGQIENDHRLLAQRAVPPYNGCVTG
ncbi:hypothetical protein TELCIR_12877 [Teladorsagia circumcincta]|uniref:Nucleolar protein 6 n=1 Tax=Teladorsagia circumcincta TaxID=45464 RepID=A0A2G9U702_TELCI|nr:hypothetical protein TELCIR_12877 [Teladorsagia circumcincta]